MDVRLLDDRVSVPIAHQLVRARARSSAKGHASVAAQQLQRLDTKQANS
jgi:hypothetical protein